MQLVYNHDMASNIKRPLLLLNPIYDSFVMQIHDKINNIKGVTHEN